MKTLNVLTALALVAMLAILPGCGETSAPEDIPRAVTNTDEPAEAPAEAPMEVEAPAEAPAEEPMEVEAPAEAPAEPAEPVEAPAEPAPAAAAAPATYTIEPNDVNIIGFTGYKVTGNQQGGWSNYSGTVELPDGAIESAKITINIDMTSLFSGNPTLTETLHGEDWFDIEGHPEATFTSSKVVKAEDGYTVSGDLNMRGVSKNISFPAQISVEGDQLMTQAKFAVNRQDWGIKSEGFAGDLVKDEVVIQFDIVADKAS